MDEEGQGGRGGEAALSAVVVLLLISLARRPSLVGALRLRSAPLPLPVCSLALLPSLITRCHARGVSHRPWPWWCR